MLLPYSASIESEFDEIKEHLRDSLKHYMGAAGVKVIYTFRLLSPGAAPIDDLKSVNARAAGYIWRHYREHVDTFAIGNEPDWHAFHAYDGHPLDPAIYE